jgi:hypothetical protein
VLKLSSRPRRYLVLAATLFLIAAIAIFLKKPIVSEQSVTLGPNDSVSVTSSSQLFPKTLNELDFLIPLDTPNSKLLEIGNSEESISIFKVDDRAYIYFVGQGKGNTKFVTDPVGMPLDSDKENYFFNMELDESQGTIELNTSAINYLWKVPSKAGFTEIKYLESGNAPKFEFQLIRTTGVDKSTLLLMLLTLFTTTLLIVFRKQIWVSARLIIANRNVALLDSKRLTLGLLALGSVGLFLLPPAPPTGVLTSGEVDLTTISKSDFTLINDDLNGGWIFRNPPEVKYNTTDYSSTLNFEIDIDLDSESSYTQIFAYGIPMKKDSSPKSKNNFEITMNARQGLYFKVPNKDGRANFYTSKLDKGLHKISGQIRNGRELELKIDGTLVYAMSSQDPIYLPIEPNLFISEYLLENVSSGKIGWEVGAEAATPVKYALHRLQIFAIVATIFSSLLLLGVRIMRREKVPPFADANSRKVLVSSIVTFITLSVLGWATWFMALQPVASITQPRNYPLFLTQYRFSDFYQIFLSSQNKDPYSIAEVIYPPFGMLILDLAGFMSARQGLILTMTLALATVCSFFLFLVFNRNDLTRLEKFGTLSVTTLSFPVVFAIDRGNLDLVISALLLLAIWFNSKQSKGQVAGVLIGLASAIKIYPLFLLPIFYYQKREIRTLITSVVTFVVLSALGAVRYQIGPLQFLQSVLLGSSGQEMSVENVLRWNGSFAALITTGTNLVSPSYANAVWKVMSSTSTLIIILMIGAGIALFLAKKAVDITSFAIVWLSVVSLAFPVTGAYRFTVFLLAFALLLLDGIKKQRNLTALGILLGVIASPVVYWYFDDGAVSTYSLIIPIACIFSIGLIMKNTFKVENLPENQVQS